MNRRGGHRGINWISRGRGSIRVTSFQGHGSVSFLGRVEAADGLARLRHQESLVDVLIGEASKGKKELNEMIMVEHE